MQKSTRVKLLVAACSALAGLGAALALLVGRDADLLVARVEAHGIEGVFDERDRLLAERPKLGDDDPLGRFPVPEAWARELFPPLTRDYFEFDPHCYYTKGFGLALFVRFAEHPKGRWIVRTNSLGLREDELAPDTKRRILVTGDSHTEGACREEERFTELVGDALRARGESEVEVVNAGIGGYGFYNYVGMLEKLLPLEPDVFVTVVFGGNDFMGSLLLHHLFAGTRRTPPGRAYKAANERGAAVFEPALSQEFQQLLYFRHEPREQAVALEAARAVTLEMQRLCRDGGIRFLVVYLPALGSVQRARYEPVIGDLARALELSEEDLRLTDRMVDVWLSDVRTAGVQVLDLREAFRAADVDLYWRTEHHISPAGHALVASEVLRELERGR